MCNRNGKAGLLSWHNPVLRRTVVTGFSGHGSRFFLSVPYRFFNLMYCWTLSHWTCSKTVLSDLDVWTAILLLSSKRNSGSHLLNCHIVLKSKSDHLITLPWHTQFVCDYKGPWTSMKTMNLCKPVLRCQKKETINLTFKWVESYYYYCITAVAYAPSCETGSIMCNHE